MPRVARAFPMYSSDIRAPRSTTPLSASSIPRISYRACTILITGIVIILMFPSLFLLKTLRLPNPELPVSSTIGTPSSEGLTFISLSYGVGVKDDTVNINHNCRKIRASQRDMPNRFIIYTNNGSEAFCQMCECRRFVPRQCACPRLPEDCKWRNPCEKLYFIEDMVAQFEEYVFLDTDLLIMKDEFFKKLYARSRVHDFLASYGHDMSAPALYTRDFNSGLFFIRRLANRNYALMAKEMYRTRATRDQTIVSWFIRSFYDDWDSLSYKWHCRALLKGRQTIPTEHCYTIHDRDEIEGLLANISFTRLTIPWQYALSACANDNFITGIYIYSSVCDEPIPNWATSAAK